MINPISSEGASSSDLYNMYMFLKSALYGDNSSAANNAATNTIKENSKSQTTKGLRPEETEKEVRLSSKSESNEDKNVVFEEEIVEESIDDETSLDTDTKISVDAAEVGLASSNALSNVSTSADYSEEMDYDDDGEVTMEERIRYYSEKYAQMDTASSDDGLSSLTSQENTKNLTYENKLSANYVSNATNPISNIQVLA